MVGEQVEVEMVERHLIYQVQVVKQTEDQQQEQLTLVVEVVEEKQPVHLIVEELMVDQE
jgi:hypothetical protein